MMYVNKYNRGGQTPYLHINIDGILYKWYNISSTRTKIFNSPTGTHI
ncbi:hypothetical protein SAMN02745691_01383 [Parasporobacterium paucivorans DSM 15970]|uniref:Uncharacterized protein n=1 Tax=Parasporobacterium paucivorans DSM 15970 TaxID=1122934 RepID=A0A1M6GTF1_9FIRM|nr:hypothetical protein SAMN02745691_01383 [Parasporobacterium paucivorans DSM 15970]